MSKLETYIKQEWLDNPTSKIDASDGMDFVKWMGKNLEEDFLTFMASDNIVQSELELSCAHIFKDALEVDICTTNLLETIEVEGRDMLIEEIENYNNSFDQDEEYRREGYSFDAERLM